MQKKLEPPCFLSFALVVGLLLSGCLITPPIPMRTATRNAHQTRAALPESPVVPGTTTRAQVEQDYRAFAVESGVPNLFVASYSRSKMAMVAGFAYAGGPADGRIWTQHMIVVSFRNDNTVQQFSDIPANRYFNRLVELAQTGELPPLDLKNPIAIQNGPPDAEIPWKTAVSADPLKLELSSAGIVVHPDTTVYVPRALRKGPVSIPRAQLSSIQGQSGGAVEFKFSPKSVLGKSFSLELNAAQHVTLARWWVQTGLNK